MTANTLAQPQEQGARKRIYEAISRPTVKGLISGSARLVVYGAATAVLAQIFAGDNATLMALAAVSPALKRLVNKVGGDILATMVDRVAHDDQLSAEDIQRLLAEALSAHGLDDALSEREFYRATRILEERRQTQHQAHHQAVIARLDEIRARLEQEAGRVAEFDKEALQAYLQMVARRAAHLPLGPLDPGGREGAPVSLGQVFINLDAGVEEADRREGEDGGLIVELFSAALAHIHRKPRLILLGDPGSGKSTMLRHLAYCLAQAALEPEGDWLMHLKWRHTFVKAEKELPGLVGERALTMLSGRDSGGEVLEQVDRHWDMDAPIPILVELRDFAGSDFDPHSPLALWRFIARRLEAEEMGAALPPLQAEARCGRVIFLLDGVDEVPLHRRPLVWQAIAALEDGPYGGARWAATCRILSYEPDEAPVGVPEQTLRPLSRPQIESFIDKWYGTLSEIGALKASKANALAQRLRAATGGERLRSLAENPMLLTIMALVQTYHGTLPEERARLYQQCVETLLLRWQRHKEAETGGELPAVLADLETTQAQLERLLWEIAWVAHSQAAGSDEAADIPEMTVIKIAREHLGSLARAEQFVKYTEERAHLLIGRGGTGERKYAFPHRTFQEYLAACHLAKDRRYPQEAAKLAAQGDAWREVLKLATGTLVFNQNNLERALDGVAGVLPQATPAADDEAGWRQVWLAGEMAEVVGRKAAEGDEVGQEALPRLRRQLGTLLEKGRLTPGQRAAAGVSLAKMGDDRPFASDVDGMQFCRIPAGPFWMGSETGDEDEKPARLNQRLDYDYWLGRFPVTNAQFHAFVAGGGYEEAGFWPEAAAAGLWQAGKLRKWSWRYEEQKYKEVTASGPTDFGVPFHLDNHPVVGVCWYEALAFTRWLTQRWRQAGFLPDGWQVRLPSEAEWEKGARGGRHVPDAAQIKPAKELQVGAVSLVENPQPERVFPWGEEPLAANRANYDAAGIGATSAVGCFPGGRSPYGCQEMAGNVWEWTRSLWGEAEWDEEAEEINWKELFKYPYEPGDGREDLAKGIYWLRALRGGCWADDKERWLRCASRLRGYPDGEDVNWGFRVAVSPFFTLASEPSEL